MYACGKLGGNSVWGGSIPLVGLWGYNKWLDMNDKIIQSSRVMLYLGGTKFFKRTKRHNLRVEKCMVRLMRLPQML